MIQLRSILFIGFVVSAINISYGLKNKIKLPELSKELQELINSASVNAATKFNDIVHTDFNALSSSSNLLGDLVDNTFLELDGEKFLLTDLVVRTEPVPRFLHANPDILNGFMESAVYWENFVVEGSFERYMEQNPSDIDSGKIRITWKRIDASGKISFLPSDFNDGFQSTNYDLQLTSGDVEVLFIDESEENTKIVVIESAHFGNHLQEDIFWKLQSSLPARVDAFLNNLSITELFGSNAAVANQYRKFEDAYNEMINNFADEIIRMVQAGVKESGFWRFKIPDIKEEFSKKFVFIRFWGHLSMWNGEAEDVRTLKRKNNFSLMINNGTYDVTGSVSIGKLSAGYGNYQAKIWNIGPSGSVYATVSDNSFSFKLRAILDERYKMGFKIETYSFKAHIERISVQATGLGIFDWLLSLVATLVINIFKGDISAIIEDGADKAIDELLNIIS